MAEPDEDFSVDTEGGEYSTGWLVVRAQTSRGFGRREGSDDQARDFVGLSLWCADLEKPGEFLFSAENAEQVALALLDSARKAMGKP